MALTRPPSHPMNLIFLGTSGAWSIPELGCHCKICQQMRQNGEERRRTALLFSGETNLLIDCGPDINFQLSDQKVDHLDALLLTHEHGDHYLGMDELVSFKRNSIQGEFKPISVYATKKSWEVVSNSFGYLEQLGVIKVYEVKVASPYQIGEFEVTSFKTEHGPFALGSVGYIFKANREGKEIKIVYTSDFVSIPEPHPDLFQPDYLIIPSYWFNEPIENRANQMSFQKAMEYITLWAPRKEVFLVHIGDGDSVMGDPANSMSKKVDPANPLCSPKDGNPYPIPLCQEQWQKTIDLITSEIGFPCKVTVAYDGLSVPI